MCKSRNVECGCGDWNVTCCIAFMTLFHQWWSRIKPVTCQSHSFPIDRRTGRYCGRCSQGPRKSTEGFGLEFGLLLPLQNDRIEEYKQPNTQCSDGPTLQNRRSLEINPIPAFEQLEAYDHWPASRQRCYSLTHGLEFAGRLSTPLLVRGHGNPGLAYWWALVHDYVN